MMKRWLIGLSFAVLAPLAWALPSVAEVQAQVQKGHYAEAESMMREVVAAKPGSARAHYVYAEILAHNDRFAQAAEEASRARTLDPSLKFSDPEKFRAFEQLLDREQKRARSEASPLNHLGPSVPATTATAPLAPARPVAPPSRIEEPPASSGLPGWVWPVGIVALAVLAWRMLRRTGGGAANPVVASPGYGATAGYPPGPGYGPGGVPGAGSGLVGVGLAAAGGVAAGMLAEKMLERGRESGGSGAVYEHPFDDGRGNSSDADARALENRDVDFGSGNDWGDGGGAIDLGGGSDDGSW